MYPMKEIEDKEGWWMIGFTFLLVFLIGLSLLYAGNSEFKSEMDSLLGISNSSK